MILVCFWTFFRYYVFGVFSFFSFFFFSTRVCRLLFLLRKEIKRYHCQVLEHAYDSEARLCHVVKMPDQGMVGKQGALTNRLTTLHV